MAVLGLSFYFHDAAACLIENGRLVAAAEEERFSRIKHDNRFPARAVQFCLDAGRINAADIEYAVFYEKPEIKLDRVLATIGKYFPKSRKIFSAVAQSWGREKLWVAETIRSRLGLPRRKVLFSEHHLSHAASAYYCSPFSESAILTVDGVGEWATATFGSARGTEFQRTSEVMFPHSIGLFYTAMTAFLGFEVNDGEYKVMGMAPYGEPRYTDKIMKLFSGIRDDGLELNMDYFSYEYSSDSSLSPRFLELFGEPRKPEEPFFLPQFAGELGERNDVPAETQRRSRYFADIAASAQQVVEEIMIRWASHLRRSTGLDNLCIAGGVAYNSAANGKLIASSGFRDVYIPPGAGDSGGAIGAALAVHHSEHPRAAPCVMDHAFWGKSYADGEIQAALDHAGYAYEKTPSEDVFVREIAGALAAQRVVAWFQGRFEFGPRALGHRSILADPRDAKMKETVNARIKFRELFRPFAPACAVEHAGDYFEFPQNGRNMYPYRFMLCVVPVKPERRGELPAVTHVDGSARVQIVDGETNPLFYRLIREFGDQTGVYALLNTSFNRRGEPIVESPEDALRTFEWTAIDVLAIGPFIVRR